MGQIVSAGALLATADNTGCTSGSHLHFEVRDPLGNRVDPYGQNPNYPNCGEGALWATCPPTPYNNDDNDGDGYDEAQGDCDDNNASINPGANEVCNYIDDNCNGQTDEGFPDLYGSCTAGEGECANTGVFVCANDFTDTACSTAPGLPRTEICDGLDNNCNGQVDEGFGPEICGNGLDDDCDGETDEVTTSPNRLTNAPSWSEWPSIAANPNGFGLLWLDWRDGSAEVYFILLDQSGIPVINETQISSSPYDLVFPLISWNGTEFGAFWRGKRDGRHNTELAYTRISATGAEIGSEMFLTNAAECSDMLSVDWDGNGYDLVWLDCRSGEPEIFFARINEDGSKLLDDRALISTTNIRNPDIAWNGENFGIAYECHPGEDQEICFISVNENGEIIFGPYRLTNAVRESAYPQIAWTGGHYAIVWHDGRQSLNNYDIYAILLNPDGSIAVPETRVFDSPVHSSYPSIAWSEELGLLGIVWQEGTSNSDEELFFRTIDESGTLGPARQLTENDAYDRYADIVWDGSAFRLVWSEDVGGLNLELFTSLIACED
ncbi:hypothetical protein HYT45_01195 [Candidatus Uhrbacteria bacterium]|nr:hypothetical protein [Candidatus Uhrbacteria bacterium]